MLESSPWSCLTGRRRWIPEVNMCYGSMMVPRTWETGSFESWLVCWPLRSISVYTWGNKSLNHGLIFYVQLGAEKTSLQLGVVPMGWGKLGEACHSSWEVFFSRRVDQLLPWRLKPLLYIADWSDIWRTILRSTCSVMMNFIFLYGWSKIALVPWLSGWSIVTRRTICCKIKQLRVYKKLSTADLHPIIPKLGGHPSRPWAFSQLGFVPCAFWCPQPHKKCCRVEGWRLQPCGALLVSWQIRIWRCLNHESCKRRMYFLERNWAAFEKATNEQQSGSVSRQVSVCFFILLMRQ